MKRMVGLAAGLLLIASSLSALQDVPGQEWEQQMLAGRAAMEAGRFGEAEGIYAGIVAACETSGAADARLGLSLSQLGAARMALGHHAEASSLMMRSVAILRTGPESVPGVLATTLQGLGSAFYYQHLYAKARNAYSEALELRTHAPTPDQRAIADLLSNLGSVYQIEGRLSEARASLERARDLLDHSNHADALFKADILTNLATLDRAEGRHEEAESTYREAVHLLEGVQDPDGVLTTSLLNNLALECMLRKEYGEAGRLLSQAVARIEAGAALPRTDVAQILDHYRECLQKSGNRKEARRLDSRAKSILSLLPRQPADGLTVEASELGRGR